MSLEPACPNCNEPHAGLRAAHWLEGPEAGIVVVMGQSLTKLTKLTKARGARGSRCLLSIALALASEGCFSGYGPERHVSGYRSPSYDYQQQQRAAGGDALGADGKQAADKLAEGPTQKSLSPGWKLRRKDGLSYDLKQRVGGDIDPPHEEYPAAPRAK